MTTVTPILKYKTIGQYIRIYRRALDQTQEDVAKAVKISRMTLAQIEKGNSSQMETIKSILQFLKSKGAPEIDASILYTAA